MSLLLLPHSASPVERQYIDPTDLGLMARAYAVADEMNPTGTHLVVTGSYGIHAVTGNGGVTHNDIDLNLCTPEGRDNASTVTAIAHRLGESFGSIGGVSSDDSEADSFVYTIATPQGDRRVELGVRYYGEASVTPGGVLLRSTLGGRQIIVPLVVRTLVSATGETTILAKSLEFAIATWALRISGQVDRQKRTIRPTDVAHYLILQAVKYDRQTVEELICSHPQAPPSIDPDKVLTLAEQYIQEGSNSEV